MTDQVKEQDNKDQESGRPVQLDPEEQGGTPDEATPDEAQPDEQGREHHRPPSQQPARSR